jgi:hypothetical protein
MGFSGGDAQNPFMGGVRASGFNQFGNSTQMAYQRYSDESSTNRIHFFKFDQRILTFYNIETDKKTRELLNIDFNIPIRFCSIQTKDGRIFITGGARNSS